MSPLPAIDKSQLLLSGEFAKLCNTTKETLRHYARVGVLEPVVVDAGNGYKYYSPLQVFDYLLIAALQRSGSSLADIASYLAHPQELALLGVMEERVSAIKAERKRLLIQQRMLEGMLAQSRRIKEWADCDRPWMTEELSACWFVEFDLSQTSATGFESFATKPEAPTTDHENPTVNTEVPVLDREAPAANPETPTANPEARAVNHEIPDEVDVEGIARFVNDILPYGCGGHAQRRRWFYRIGSRAVTSGHPEGDFRICIEVATAQERKHAVERPAGTYFKMLRSFTVSDMLAEESRLFDEYARFVEHAKAAGFKPVGDIYEQELSPYAGRLDEKVYSELSVRVEER